MGKEELFNCSSLPGIKENDLKKEIKVLLILLFFLTASGTALLPDVTLKQIKTIGDDREDYTIFGLVDGLLTEKKDIYILSAKGNFVAKYDWNGNFKGRFGQRGQGPGDFNFPNSIAYLNNKLFVLDKGNHRVGEIDLESNKIEYYKEDINNKFWINLDVLSPDLFCGVFYYEKKNRGRIGIVNKKWEIKNSFFNKYPIVTSVDLEKFEIQNDAEAFARKSIYSLITFPVFYLDREKKEFFVTFRVNNNPLMFFVFDINGKQLREFSFPVDEKYRFSSFYLDSSIDTLRNVEKWPDRHEPVVDSLAIYNDYYIAFISLIDFKKKIQISTSRFCAIFDRNGVLKHRFPVKDSMRIFRYSQGYFLGTDKEEDDEKLYIFQMQF